MHIWEICNTTKVGNACFVIAEIEYIQLMQVGKLVWRSLNANIQREFPNHFMSLGSETQKWRQSKFSALTSFNKNSDDDENYIINFYVIGERDRVTLRTNDTVTMLCTRCTSMLRVNFFAECKCKTLKTISFFLYVPNENQF